MCSNCWKIRCHNFACNWLCLHWTFIDFFFICMGGKNYVNLCLKAKVKPCMERRECQRWTDTQQLFSRCSALVFLPSCGQRHSPLRALKERGTLAQLFFLPELPIFGFLFRFVLFSLACNLIRFCQVNSHIVYAYCMRITRKPFKVVKWYALQDSSR